MDSTDATHIAIEKVFIPLQNNHFGAKQLLTIDHHHHILSIIVGMPR
jgi:hypothetical protein